MLNCLISRLQKEAMTAVVEDFIMVPQPTYLLSKKLVLFQLHISNSTLTTPAFTYELRSQPSEPPNRSRDSRVISIDRNQTTPPGMRSAIISSR
jgi:hypothetical protein